MCKSDSNQIKTESLQIKKLLKKALPMLEFLKAYNRVSTHKSSRKLFNRLGITQKSSYIAITTEQLKRLDYHARLRAKEYYYPKNGRVRYKDTPFISNGLERLLVQRIEQRETGCKIIASAKNSPAIVGPYVLDVGVLGLASRNHLATFFESNGNVHEWKKATKDELLESTLMRLGFDVVPYSTTLYFEEWGTHYLDSLFRELNTERAVKKIPKAEELIRLFNIATWLTFEDMDHILGHGGALCSLLRRLYLAFKQHKAVQKNPSRFKKTLLSEPVNKN